MKTRYIPKDFELIAKDERYGFEVWGTLSPRVLAIAYGGKRTKSDWYCSFRDEAALHRKISETLSGYIDWEERKQARKTNRNKPHNVEIGDIFRASWGYDQTNIDFYQCTNVFGSMIEIREIGQMREETLSMQGECVPSADNFIGEPMRKKVSMYGDEPSVKIYDFANAYRMKPLTKIGDKAIYKSSHWTAYA